MLDFVVLILPLILALMIVTGLICLCRRRARWMGVLLLLGAVGVNGYTECIPVRWTGKEEKGDFKILTYNIYTASDYYQT